MGGESCFEGHVFESQHCILDGHFSHLPMCCKNCNVFVEKTKINQKEAEDGPLIKIS